MDNKEHVKDCKELMQELANKVDLQIELKEYQEKKFNGIEILLRDKKGYLIYKTYDDVSNIIGFINGYRYNLNKNE